MQKITVFTKTWSLFEKDGEIWAIFSEEKLNNL